MPIGEKIKEIKGKIPENVKLVAVSKTKPNQDILEAYHAGQRVFGENKVQEVVSKYEALPKDIEWHFIGHLQTNKVKYIAPFISLIHSVDSFKILQIINKEAEKCHRVISVLLQFHIATEESKFGLSKEEAIEIIESEAFSKLNHICIRGVMGMATFTDDMEQVRSEFSNLKSIFTQLKTGYFNSHDSFCEISMGMSDDYLVAMEEGSTMIRVGSTIFGTRNYT